MSDNASGFSKGEERLVSLPPKLWTAVFFGFVLLNLFIFMGFDLLLPTLTLYLEKHGRSEAEIGRIFGTFTISAILTRMFASHFARKMDAMRLVSLGLLGCALAGISYIWAHTLLGGVAVRFLHGAGFGLASTLITALASQVIPPARMGEGMGYLGLGTTLALALGPFFGIWLVDEFGYTVLFSMVAAVYVGGIVVVCLSPKIKLASSDPKAPRPKVVFLSRKVMVPSLLMFLVGLIMSSVTIYMALFCNEQGLPYAGHFFVFSAIGLLIARLTAGRLHDRFGHRYVLGPSGVLLLVSMLLLAFMPSRETIFTVSIIYGLSTGAIFPSLQAVTFSLVPLSGRTEATASFFNSFDLGMGVGSLSLGYLASKLGSYSSVYLGSAGAAVVFLLFYLIYYLFLNPVKAQKKQEN